MPNSLLAGGGDLNRHCSVALRVTWTSLWRMRQNRAPARWAFSENGARRVGPADQFKRLHQKRNRTNEVRAKRDLPPLPPVSPHALRRTYISLLIEAGAPLPYVMRQVGHEDSRTTLEVYAQMQQRLSRKQVHQAFDDLLASAGEAANVPTEGREKMSRSALASIPPPAGTGEEEGAEIPGGPRKWSTNAS